jgi:hypothetical protein
MVGGLILSTMRAPARDPPARAFAQAPGVMVTVFGEPFMVPLKVKEGGDGMVLCFITPRT